MLTDGKIVDKNVENRRLFFLRKGKLALLLEREV
jgi:hypothetical protein